MGSARYRVEWTVDAEGDALGIVGRFDSRTNADRVLLGFDKRAKSLASLPERGRIVPELERIGIMQYHEVLLDPWRMLFEIRDHVVFIVAVFDGRRDLADVLFERFARP
jgi:toxin ParE1/3/4